MLPDTRTPAPATSHPGVAADAYRAGMSRLGAAVNIITTDGPAGRAGFTASAVCSVTDTPPTLLVCLNRAASVYDVFTDNRVLCVNVLRPEHEALSGLFGGRTPMESRFAAADWTLSVSGAPLLAGASVSFDCRIVDTAEVGTHTVLYCAVLDVVFSDAASGLVYFDRRYHGLREIG